MMDIFKIRTKTMMNWVHSGLVVKYRTELDDGYI